MGEIQGDGEATESLQPEETLSFESLGLIPGDWAALLPLPFLSAVWSDQFLDKQERKQVREVIDSILRWPSGPARPTDAGVDQARNDFYGPLLFEGRATPVVVEKLREAVDLLAWFLAKRCDRGQRLGYQQRYQELAKLHRVDSHCFAETLDHLRIQVDLYLACRCFVPSPTEIELDFPDLSGQQRLSGLPWQTSLVAPLAQLVVDSQSESSRLSTRMETEISDSISRQRGVLREFLNDSGWKDFYNHITNSPASSVHERLEACLRYCSASLAALPLRSREDVIAELQRIAKTLESHWLSFSRTGLTAEQIAHCFEALAEKVEEVRSAVAVALPIEEVPEEQETVTSDEQLLNDSSVVEDSIPPVVNDLVADLSPSPVFAPKVPEILDSPTDQVVCVREVTDFPVVPWDECLKLASDFDTTTYSILQDRALLFGEHQSEGESIVIVPQDCAIPESLWFIGDIHCDLLTMVNAWNYIQTVSRNEGLTPHVVFLGDFIDRGTHGCETLAYLFRLLQEHPGQIAVVPGNHDEFHWNAEAERFEIGVEPAETIIQLNQHLVGNDPRDTAFVELGKIAAKFFESLPRAIILPDGTLLAHGGFPHADLLDSLQHRADLSKPDCLYDFIWLRAANVRRRRPSRYSSGTEFGRENFADFCEIATDRLGVPVARLVRGHDHVKQRYQSFDDWPNPVLTINTMGRQAGEYGVEQFPPFVVARHRANALPEIHCIKIDESEYAKAYPPEPTGEVE